MLFNSLEFIAIYLPLVLCGWWVARRYLPRGSIFLLALCSLFFYGWWKWEYLYLIVGSILVNYTLASRILALRETATPVARRWLVLGVTLNLALLVYYKYTNFMLDNLFRLGLGEQTWVEIVLPLAISFFTFQQIAYLVDCWRGEIVNERRDFLTYTAFVTFFPQLIAGPIVRHNELIPQFSQKRERTELQQYFVAGICIFLLGLFKKVCIADTIAGVADPVFNRAEAGLILDMVSAWVGSLAYTLQIYFDFSGYSDMAFGLGMMFGLRLPINFFSPYQATCINEFWRRWNITLGAFFRDYLYIPLGGGRASALRVAFNVSLVMFLSGLWHGAGWNFVLWGLCHGLGMVVATWWGQVRPGLPLLGNCNVVAYRVFSITLTFLFALLAWVLFRSSDLDAALRMYQAMFSFDIPPLSAFWPTEALKQANWLWLLPLSLLVFLAPNSLSIMGVDRDGGFNFRDLSLSAYRLAGIGVLFALSVIVLLNGHSQNFLYFIF